MYQSQELYVRVRRRPFLSETQTHDGGRCDLLDTEWDACFFRNNGCNTVGEFMKQEGVEVGENNFDITALD